MPVTYFIAKDGKQYPTYSGDSVNVAIKSFLVSHSKSYGWTSEHMRQALAGHPPKTVDYPIVRLPGAGNSCCAYYRKGVEQPPTPVPAKMAMAVNAAYSASHSKHLGSTGFLAIFVAIMALNVIIWSIWKHARNRQALLNHPVVTVVSVGTTHTS